jgi:hypothetical protein
MSERRLCCAQASMQGRCSTASRSGVPSTCSRPGLLHSPTQWPGPDEHLVRQVAQLRSCSMQRCGCRRRGL